MASTYFVALTGHVFVFIDAAVALFDGYISNIEGAGYRVFRSVSVAVENLFVYANVRHVFPRAFIRKV